MEVLGRRHIGMLQYHHPVTVKLSSSGTSTCHHHMTMTLNMHITIKARLAYTLLNKAVMHAL